MIVYLASPYTHSDKTVMALRCQQVQRVCAELARRHINVFSPIAHWHPISVVHNLPHEFLFWEELDRKMIRALDEFWILTLDGWTESVGVKAEIRIAIAAYKKIQLLDPIFLFLEPFRV